MNGHTDVVRPVTLSRDGSRLASGAQGGTLKIWDLVSRREVLTLRDHEDMVLSIAFSPDGNRLASSDLSGLILVPSGNETHHETKLTPAALAG